MYGLLRRLAPVLLYATWMLLTRTDVGLRCWPSVAAALQHHPGSLSVYDVAVWLQKLLPCVLVMYAVDEYVSALAMLLCTLVVFWVWVQARPHGQGRVGDGRVEDVRPVAMVLLSSVLGLQLYMVVHATSVGSVSGHAAAGTMKWLFYVVFGWVCVCLLGVGSRVWAQMSVLLRGPARLRHRIASFHHTKLTRDVWLERMSSSVSGRGALSSVGRVTLGVVRPRRKTLVASRAVRVDEVQKHAAAHGAEMV